jgi:hypothetical protein
MTHVYSTDWNAPSYIFTDQAASTDIAAGIANRTPLYYVPSEGGFFYRPVGSAPVRVVTPSAFAAQTANRVLAGPASGAAAVPTFRALVDDDIPAALTLVGSVIDFSDIGNTTPSAGTFNALAVKIGGFKAIFSHANTVDRTYTYPNYNGTMATQAGTETFTNKTLSTGTSISADVLNTATGYFEVAQGTTAQRPGSPAVGMVRWNSDTSRYEFYNGSAWVNHVRLSGDTMTGALTIAVDSTGALQVTNSGATWTGIDIDTTNQGIGIGMTAPQANLHLAAGTLLQVDGDMITPWFGAGGYTNFISQSNTFTNASWTKTGVTAAATATDPTNTANGASNITNGGVSTDGLSQQIANSTTGSWTGSVWMRAQSGAFNASINIVTDGETPTAKTVALTTTWKRYFVTQTLNVAHTTKTFSIINGTNGAISVFRAQLDNSAYMRGYASTTTSAVTTQSNRFRFFTDVTADLTFQVNSTFTATVGGTSSGAAWTMQGNAIAATSTDRGFLQNATAATAGVPVQMSPRLRWSGGGWDTNGGGSAKTFNAKAELTPVSANPAYATLDFGMDPATGTYATMFSIFSGGAYSGVSDAMTYASTISLNTQKGNVHTTTTVNATGNATINASDGGKAGQWIALIITNDATSGKVITFGTNFKSSGTLTGTTSKTATIYFLSDGTNWWELTRQMGLS